MCPRVLATVKTAVRRVAEATRIPEVHQDIKQTVIGHEAYNEDDTHADTAILGANFRLLETTGEVCDVVPYSPEYKPIKNIPIVSAVTAVQSPETGEVAILLFHQGLWYGNKMPSSLINPNQIRHIGHMVNNDPTDKDRYFGISTNQEFDIPFEMVGTTARWKSWVPSDEELNSNAIRWIEMTEDLPWDPANVTIGSVKHTREEEEFRKIKQIRPPHKQDAYAIGEDEDPISHELSNARNFIDQLIDKVNVVTTVRTTDDEPKYKTSSRALANPSVSSGAVGSEHRHSRVTPEELARKFGCGIETAKRTLKTTTQRGVRHALHPLHRRYRVDHLDKMRRRLDKTFFTDTFYSKVKSADGNTCAQIFTNGKFTKVYPMPDHKGKTLAEKVSAFTEDVGIPSELIMDQAPEQIKGPMMEEARRLRIKIRWTEAGQHPQNYAAEQEILGLKRRWQIKRQQKNIPKRLWDWCLVREAEIMSIIARGKDGRPGIEEIVGHTYDISEYLDFDFYDLVWWWDPTVNETLEEAKERRRLGRWLGVAHRVGSQMVYWILSDTCQVVAESTVQHVLRQDLQVESVQDRLKQFEVLIQDKLNDNRWLLSIEPQDRKFYLEDLLDGPGGREVGNQAGTAEADSSYGDNWAPDTPEQEFESLAEYDKYINAMVQLDRDGEKLTGRVSKRRRNEAGVPIGSSNENVMFDFREYEVEMSNGTTEYLTANNIAACLYAQCDIDGNINTILDEIIDYKKDNRALSSEKGWSISSTGVKSPKATTVGWKLLCKWKDDTTSWVSLKDLKESNPVELAEFAVIQRLQDEPAFRWWVPSVLKKRERIISKLKKKYWRTEYKFGVQVPKTVDEAYRLDTESETDYWTKAIEREMTKLRPAVDVHSQHTPDQIRSRQARDTLVGYQEIPVHWVFDVKMDLTRRARFVAGGHKTETPTCGMYSSVVSRDSVRIAMTLCSLYDLKLWACDISNAYLNADCREKVWFKAGREWGEDQGLVIVVKKALNGLKSSGAAFRALLRSTIEGPRLKFRNSIADHDVYIREASTPNGTEYFEQMLVYVDDILIVSHDPQAIIKELQAVYELKKGSVGPPTTYLGAQVMRSQGRDGTLKWAMTGEKYCKEAISIVKDLMKNEGFHWKNKMSQPIPKGYKPELDTTEECSEEQHSKFMQLIGILRWMTELGRLDILYGTSSLSQFMASPRIGHLQAAYHLFGWVSKHLHSGIVFDDTPIEVEVEPDKDWSDIYGDTEEELPPRMPRPRGQAVEIHAFVDANHAGNAVTRRSHTGILIFINNSPIMWYSKRQNTVEASSFGSEFVALRVATEMVIALRFKLRMFGVRLTGPANVFCDNQGVVKNASIPESALNKKHNAINYHMVRENVARRIIKVTKEATETNIADVFTKALDGAHLTSLLSGALTWVIHGNTEPTIENGIMETNQNS